MKLSDIGDLQKMAGEFRAFENILQFAAKNRIDSLVIVMRGSNAGQEAKLEWNSRNTVPAHALCDSLSEVLLTAQDLIRTKLAMCGVDDFEK